MAAVFSACLTCLAHSCQGVVMPVVKADSCTGSEGREGERRDERERERRMRQRIDVDVLGCVYI